MQSSNTENTIISFNHESAPYEYSDLTYGDRIQRTTLNSSTDAGAYFEGGNIPIILQQSVSACIPSAIVGLTAASARLAGEFKKSGFQSLAFVEIEAGLKSSPLTNNQATKWLRNKATSLFNKIVDNPNVGLEVSAIGLGVSSAMIPIEAAIQADPETLSTLYHWGQEELIVGCFAVSNGLNGLAMRDSFKEYDASMKSIATLAATSGMIMTNIPLDSITTLQPDPFYASAAILTVGGAQGLYQGIKNVGSQGWLQPQLIMGGGCFANSAIHLSQGNFAEALANGLWGVAFISLDAVFKAGGLHQKYFSPKTKEPLPAPDNDLI